MKKCEGHINWFTCEKTTYYRLKQEFCVFFFFGQLHWRKSTCYTGGNVSYTLKAVPIIELKWKFVAPATTSGCVRK